MTTLDAIKLVSEISKRKKQIRELRKGEQFRGLDLMTFKQDGKTYHLSIYVDCMKED